jgi:hypothetical protein
MTEPPERSISPTAARQPSETFKRAEGFPDAPSSTSTAGRSVLSVGPTVVVRAIRGPSVAVPFDVEREIARRENREANRGERDSPSGPTDNSR